MRSFIIACLAGVLIASTSRASLADGSDIVKAGSGLTLGTGWYKDETSQGRSFRWVSNDSEIVIHRPQTDLKKLALAIQGGPGLDNAQNFVLHVSNGGHEIAMVHVPGTETLRLDIPVQAGHDSTIKLHVDGGGKKIPKDVRTLNFRVFTIDEVNDPNMAAGHPDIAESPIQIGKNWFPLEQSKNETFRWVQNDAEFSINASKDGEAKIRIVAASGPAVKSPAKWTLAVEDGSGKTIDSSVMKARGSAIVPITFHQGENTFKLHVDSTGAKAPNDPRVLSFRVFSLTH